MGRLFAGDAASPERSMLRIPYLMLMGKTGKRSFGKNLRTLLEFSLLHRIGRTGYRRRRCSPKIRRLHSRISHLPHHQRAKQTPPSQYRYILQESLPGIAFRRERKSPRSGPASNILVPSIPRPLPRFKVPVASSLGSLGIIHPWAVSPDFSNQVRMSPLIANLLES